MTESEGWCQLVALPGKALRMTLVAGPLGYLLGYCISSAFQKHPTSAVTALLI